MLLPTKPVQNARYARRIYCTWSASVDSSSNIIYLNVYLFVSASRTIDLPSGKATVNLSTEMPWQGKTELSVEAPEGWKWEVRLPKLEYAAKISVSPNSALPNFSS